MYLSVHVHYYLFFNLPNTFDYKIVDCQKDDEGRYNIIDLDITNLFRLTMINLYASNFDDNIWYKDFLNKILKS